LAIEVQIFSEIGLKGRFLGQVDASSQAARVSSRDIGGLLFD